MTKSNDKIAGLFQDPSEKVLRSLPEGYSPDEAKRLALYLRGNAELSKCSAESLYQCVLQSAALGLAPDLKEVYFVRYGQTAQMMISYTGLIKLAKRSGKITHVFADVVREGDLVKVVSGSSVAERRIYHEPVAFSDAPIIGAYAVFKFSDGVEDFERLTLGDLKAIRSKASGGSMMWNEFFCEAAKKAAIRRGIKRMELLPDDARAIVEAEDREYDYSAQQSAPVQRANQLFAPKPAPQLEEGSEPVEVEDDGPDTYDDPIDV